MDKTLFEKHKPITKGDGNDRNNKIRENCKQYISPLPATILDLYLFPKCHECLSYTF